MSHQSQQEAVISPQRAALNADSQFEAEILRIAVERYEYSAGDALLKTVLEKRKNGHYCVDWVEGARHGWLARGASAQAPAEQTDAPAQVELTENEIYDLLGKHTTKVENYYMEHQDIDDVDQLGFARDLLKAHADKAALLSAPVQPETPAAPQPSTTTAAWKVIDELTSTPNVMDMALPDAIRSVVAQARVMIVPNQLRDELQRLAQFADQATRMDHRDMQNNLNDLVDWLTTLSTATEQREPMFWVRLRSDGQGWDGPIPNDSLEDARKRSGAWLGLYLGMVHSLNNGSTEQPRTGLPQSYVNDPLQTGVGLWCGPGPADKQERLFVLRFEDADRGECHYTDEAEARSNFAQAEARGWNCHLFGHLPRASQPTVTPDLQSLIASALNAPCASRRGNDFREGYLEAKVDILRLLRKLPTTHDASHAQSMEAWRHIANEWAYMATNGLQWVRNIADGTSTAQAALENLTTDLQHCRAVNDAGPVAKPAGGDPKQLIVPDVVGWMWMVSQNGDDYDMKFSFGAEMPNLPIERPGQAYRYAALISKEKLLRLNPRFQLIPDPAGLVDHLQAASENTKK